MKQFKFLSAVCCMVAVAAFSSCLFSDDDDDTDKSLTPTQVAQCFATIGGDYQGKLIYYAAGSAKVAEAIDTLDISWSIASDSTLVIHQFPAEAVANGITYAPLREALAEQPGKTLNCYIGFVSASPIEFLINPWTLTYNVVYEGEEHKVQVLFYVYSAYSFGTYDATTKELMMKIVEGGLYIDGKQSAYLSSDIPIVFKSEKK